MKDLPVHDVLSGRDLEAAKHILGATAMWRGLILEMAAMIENELVDTIAYALTTGSRRREWIREVFDSLPFERKIVLFADVLKTFHPDLCDKGLMDRLTRFRKKRNEFAHRQTNLSGITASLPDGSRLRLGASSGRSRLNYSDNELEKQYDEGLKLQISVERISKALLTLTSASSD